jgi:ATP-dependent HslUV protease ATP-binding subunit HslU
MRVGEALDYLIQEEEQKLIDMDQVTRVALERVERNGIIFLDEIDKIAGREGGHGPDVSREGVQRDILPIVEGHHRQHALRLRPHRPHPVHRRRRVPRLQAQRPDSRTAGPLPHPRGAEVAFEEDFIRILKRAEERSDEAVHRPARHRGHQADLHRRRAGSSGRLRSAVNESSENIGARRLHTIMEKVVEEISFAGPDLKKKNVRIDAEYVHKRLADIVKDQDLSKYIL